MLVWAALLLASSTGAPAPGPHRAAHSFRAEGREVAELRSVPLVDAVASRAPASPGPALLDPGMVPFPAYGPDDWLRIVAGRFGLRDLQLTCAAGSLLALPVHVDLSPRHLRVTLRLAIP